MTGRVTYAEAGEAHREAVRRAMVAPKLRDSDFKVLLVLGTLLGSYSKIEDEVTRDQLAELTGLNRSTVTAAVGRLHRAGVIVWVSGNGRGQRSRVSFASPEAGEVELPFDGESTDAPGVQDAQKAMLELSPQASPQAGERVVATATDSTAKGSSPDRERVVAEGLKGRRCDDHTTEKTEKKAEGRDAAAAAKRMMTNKRAAGLVAEVTEIVAAAERRHGPEVVDRALGRMLDAGFRFRWPESEFAPRLDGACAAVSGARHLPGTGWIERPIAVGDAGATDEPAVDPVLSVRRARRALRTVTDPGEPT